MTHRKKIATVAIIMIIVFGFTVLIYPMLFNADSKAPLEAAPPPVAPITAPGN